MIDHDGGYHRLFSQPQLVAELLRDVIKPPWLPLVDLSTLKRVNFKLHGKGLGGAGIRRRDGDVLWKVRHRQGHDVYIYLILEFQSSVDPWMAVRIVVYVGHLYQHLIQEGRLIHSRLPPVFPIVLYNGARPWSAATQLRDLIALPHGSALDDFQPNIRYHIIDEMRVPAQQLEHLKSVLSVVLLLEQCQDQKQAIALFKRLHSLVAADEMATIRRALGDFLEASGAGQALHARPGQIRRVLNGDTSMIAENAKLWVEQLKEAGRAEGIETGLEKGLERGLALGRAEGRQQAIVDLLMLRFGVLPDELMERLTTITDAERLTELTGLAATSNSLAAFEAGLEALRAH